MANVEVTEIKGPVKKDWTLELTTLGVVGIMALIYKLSKKNSFVREAIRDVALLSSVTILPLITHHFICNVFGPKERVEAVEIKSNNLYDILKTIFGSDWRSKMSVEDYNYMRDEFENSGRTMIRLELK